MLKLEILGSGCANCRRLAENTITAADKLELEYNLIKVKELNEIVGYGIMTPPALVVDGEVKSQGRVPQTAEIIEILESLK